MLVKPIYPSDIISTRSQQLMIFCITFFIRVFKIQCVFYNYNTSQFGTSHISSAQ